GGARRMVLEDRRSSGPHLPRARGGGRAHGARRAHSRLPAFRRRAARAEPRGGAAVKDGRAALSRARRVLVQTVKGFYADRGDDLAASLTFSTLVMAVPFAATFAILVATFFQQNDRAILDMINFALPYQSARISANLREFIESARAISGIGIVALLATSLRLIFIIESAV